MVLARWGCMYSARLAALLWMGFSQDVQNREAECAVYGAGKVYYFGLLWEGS